MAAFRIIVDRLPGYTRTALLRDGVLTDLFCDDADNPLPRPGAVVRARIERVFPDHDRVALDLGGLAGSLRIRGGRDLHSGEMIMATVTADARATKPHQLRQGIFRTGRYLLLESGKAELRLSRGLREMGYTPPPEICSPASSFTITLRRAAATAALSAVIAEREELITWAEAVLALPSSGPSILSPAPSGPEQARLLAPEADLIMDDDGVEWEEAGVDAQLESALAPTVLLPEGGCLHISTPPGAAVFDGDSGSGQLSPMQLSLAMVPMVARALRLRRIGGPVVVDFPRLNARDRRRITELMMHAVADDPCRPRCHGFTEGSLFTLTRPWSWRPLAEDMAALPARLGRDALRLARNHGARRPQHSIEIRLPPAGLDWLEGPGAIRRQALEEGLVFRPHFRSDSAIAHVHAQDMRPMRKS